MPPDSTKHTRVYALSSPCTHSCTYTQCPPPPPGGWGGEGGRCCVAQSLCILQCSKVAGDNLNGMKCPLHLEQFRNCCCRSAVDAVVMGTPTSPPPPPTTIFPDIGVPHGIPVGHAAVSSWCFMSHTTFNCVHSLVMWVFVCFFFFLSGSAQETW